LHMSGVREPSLPLIGGPDFLRRQHGLDFESLAALARMALATQRVGARRKVA